MRELISQLFHPEELINYGGLFLVVSFIFAETGLLIGMFLPGDSLLFTAGLLAGTNVFDVTIVHLFFSTLLAAIIGDVVGYWFGKKTGKHLFKIKETFYFKHEYIQRAKDFYHKYGGMAIVLGRFFPLFRTLVPVLAGVVAVDYKKFFLYNVLGGFSWIATFTLSGYFLGREFPIIKEYLEYMIILIILVSTLPVIIKLFLSKVKKKKKEIKQHPEEYMVP